jgi:hypothetical protein
MRDEFLELVGLRSGVFDQLQHAGFVALAFGTPLPARRGRYLDLDLVAVAINEALTPSIGRPWATAVVGKFFLHWLTAVARAEADQSQDFFLAVGGVEWDPQRRCPKRLLITNGTLGEISQNFQGTKDLFGYHTVSISAIIRRLREKAQKAGIDLSRPFFFVPGDPRLTEIVTQFTRERDARAARVKRNKNKLAAIKGWDRRQDLSAIPLANDNTYPVELQAVA